MSTAGFIQPFQSTDNQSVDIDMGGNVFSFKVTYLLNNRLEWRYARKVKRFR